MQESGATFRADHAHDLPTLRAQPASERVLVVAAEVADDLLQVDGEIHRLLVDRQMLVSSHWRLGAGRGDTPLHPRNHQITRMTESLRIHPPLVRNTSEDPGQKSRAFHGFPPTQVRLSCFLSLMALKEDAANPQRRTDWLTALRSGRYPPRKPPQPCGCERPGRTRASRACRRSSWWRRRRLRPPCPRPALRRRRSPACTTRPRSPGPWH